jgi:hypothetical protein
MTTPPAQVKQQENLIIRALFVGELAKLDFRTLERRHDPVCMRRCGAYFAGQPQRLNPAGQNLGRPAVARLNHRGHGMARVQQFLCPDRTAAARNALSQNREICLK